MTFDVREVTGAARTDALPDALLRAGYDTFERVPGAFSRDELVAQMYGIRLGSDGTLARFLSFTSRGVVLTVPVRTVETAMRFL